MEIILKETIETLGQEGEIVKVKPGYARNFLIPRQKAVLVNKASLARLDKEKQAIANYITNTAMNQAFTDTLFDRLIAIAKGENPPIESDEEKQEAVLDKESVKNEADVAVKSDEFVELPSTETDESKE